MRTSEANIRDSAESRRRGSRARSATPRGRRAGPPVALAVVLAVATGDATAQAAPAPSLGDLRPGWNSLEPGGDTGCALGDGYRFFVRPGDVERLFVYFEGGGACWNADTCDPSREPPVFVPTIEPAAHPGRRSGVFDLRRPDNPLAEFTMVFAPYCTGDVHLGDRISTYRVGETGEITVRHLGNVNATAVLDWVRSNVAGARTVVVAGSSAGAVGTPFHASRVAQAFPEARVVAIGDGAGAYRAEAMPDLDPSAWGVPDVFASTAGWGDMAREPLGIEALFAHAAESAPNLTLAQVDHARDAVQRLYLELAGTADPDVEALLDRNRTELSRDVAGFAGYTIGGVEHTVLGLPPFYFYREDRRSLVDWVSALVRGGQPGSPGCDPCERPSLAFGTRDVALLDAAIAALPDASTWLADQPRSAVCPPGADRLSLWCAIVRASRELGGPGALDYAATWAVAYEAMARLGDDHFEQPLTRYNNDEATGFPEVRDVLERVRERIARGLDR